MITHHLSKLLIRRFHAALVLACLALLGTIAPAEAACVPSASTACLQGGRFSVSVTHGGNTSQVVSSTSDSALFSTFWSTTYEIIVKVGDGCALNSRYWVFAAGATSISYDVTVQDHVRGLVIRYPSASCPLIDDSTF